MSLVFVISLQYKHSKILMYHFMKVKRIFLSLSMLLAMSSVASAQDGGDEYVDCFVESDSGPLQSDVPLNTTTGCTKMEGIFNCVFQLTMGDIIRGIAFRGCNTGGLQQRHLTVYMEETNHSGTPRSFTPLQDMTKVADSIFTVKSGGTVAAPERILEIPFDTSFVYKRTFLRLTIVCDDGMPGDEVRFSSARNEGGHALCASGDDVSSFGQTKLVTKPQLTLMVRKPVRYVSGTVTDEEGRGIANATVTLQHEDFILPDVSGITDADGHYRIRVESGNARYYAKVTAPGHTLLNDWRLIAAGENPVRDFTLYGSATYRAGERSTIILPFAPDPTVGRYYTLNRLEGNKVVFVRVSEPQANMPYVLFADRDYHVSLEGFDLTIVPGSVELGWVAFRGTYTNGGEDSAFDSLVPIVLDDALASLYGYAVDYIALHAELYVHWEINDDIEVVFVDTPTQLHQPTMQAGTPALPCCDLQGRHLSGKPTNRGLYINDGKKVLITK